MTRYIEEKELDNYKARMEKLLVKCLHHQESNLIKIKELRARVEELEDKYEPDRELTRQEIDVFFDDLKSRLK